MNYILKYIQMENSSFKLYIFQTISVFSINSEFL